MLMNHFMHSLARSSRNRFSRKVSGFWLRVSSHKSSHNSQLVTVTQRPGYVFLISVLFVGAIAMSTAATLVVLGVGSMKSSIATMQSMQAMHNAETCVERALKSLRASASYAGNETLALTSGTCVLRPIGGSGNLNRIICAKGIVGTIVRRVEVQVSALRPIGMIKSWQEVADFHLCTES